MGNTRLIWIDTSRYNRLSYRLLADNDVYGIIAKASQGTAIKDVRYREHVRGADENGLVLGAYHWLDPMLDVQKQIDNFLDQVFWDSDVSSVDFLAIDVEQYWQDWGEWSKKTITKFIKPLVISDTALRMANALRWTDLPVIIYTRLSFVRGYAQPMESWLYKFPVWLASYPYTKTKVTCTWDELRTYWLPKSEPVKPKNVDRWTFWQFSGDKFVLPGTYGGKIDLNYFNGHEADYYHFMEYGHLPEPEPEPVGRKLFALYRMNVRHTPGDMRADAIIAKLQKGETAIELERRTVSGNKWIRCAKGWVAEVYSGVRLLEVV